MVNSKILLISIILFLIPGCTVAVDHNWHREAVWYQIFPERFRNGDTSNDPTIETLKGTWPYDKQKEWAVTPWADQWYKLQPWEINNSEGFYYNAQLRRYGGDIQGIIDKLDYLEDLGINAIYLNPVFESPSSHKYGAQYFHHIDNNFGPDPEGDELIWSLEEPSDPNTWKWTSADLLFLKLIKEVHKRNMHIIIDGVFNHVGIPFWALVEVRKNGKDSPYAEWFNITSWDDPATPEDEFDYEGWFGIKDLPELAETENNLADPVKDHIKAIVSRWMDPNGDGDPSDGIDGWRLDVAEMVPMGFWKEFRAWVDEINPQAYTTGEVWWEDYFNNKMFNAAKWLEGDAFHSVMNYRFGDAMFKFFIDQKNKISATELKDLLQGVIDDYGYDKVLQIQNLIGSHDTERLASACINPDRWIDHANNLQYNPEFDIRKPTTVERLIQKQIIAFQFTFPGVPYIYYGDEVGMWGADDPDERKPMVWPDMEYESENIHPLGLKRAKDSVELNVDLLEFYKNMIRIRRENPACQQGDYQVELVDDKHGIFAFSRSLNGNKVLAFFNSSSEKCTLDPSTLGLNKNENWQLIGGQDIQNGTLLSRGYSIYAQN